MIKILKVFLLVSCISNAFAKDVFILKHDMDLFEDADYKGIFNLYDIGRMMLGDYLTLFAGEEFELISDRKSRSIRTFEAKSFSYCRRSIELQRLNCDKEQDNRVFVKSAKGMSYDNSYTTDDCVLRVSEESYFCKNSERPSGYFEKNFKKTDHQN